MYAVEKENFNVNFNVYLDIADAKASEIRSLQLVFCGNAVFRTQCIHAVHRCCM